MNREERIKVLEIMLRIRKEQKKDTSLDMSDANLSQYYCTIVCK